MFRTGCAPEETGHQIPDAAGRDQVTDRITAGDFIHGSSVCEAGWQNDLQYLHH